MPSQAKPSQAKPKGILKTGKPHKNLTVRFADDITAEQSTLPPIKEPSTSTSDQDTIIQELNRIYPIISDITKAINKANFKSFIDNFNNLIDSQDSYTFILKNRETFNNWKNFFNYTFVSSKDIPEQQHKKFIHRAYGIGYDTHILPILDKLQELESRLTRTILPRVKKPY